MTCTLDKIINFLLNLSMSPMAALNMASTMIREILSSRTCPTEWALNNLNNLEVFGSIHCFSCDFLALQYYIICRLQYFASQTHKHHPHPFKWACNRGGVESCATSTYSLYLFIQFLSQILALIDDISRQLAPSLIPGSQHVLYLDRCIFGTLSSLKHI